ncbi:hypothetical protein REH81_03685 [Vibrio rotiferianus]
MKISEPNLIGREDRKVKDVAEYVTDAIDVDYHDREGIAEEAYRRSTNTLNAFGRLCEVLANKGVLSAQEIAYIANDRHVDDVRFETGQGDSNTKD